MKSRLLRLCAIMMSAGAAAFACLPASTGPVLAQTTGSVAVGPSGLPLPRFVSLKSGRVNLRIGPGLNYAVDWMYLKPGLPMEIIQEFDNWRRVRDADGTEGWVNQSLLSGQRTAVVAPWQRGKDASIALRARADDEAPAVALLEPGVIGTISTCNGDWCQMTVGSHRGWIGQSAIWGAYPGETLRN